MQRADIRLFVERYAAAWERADVRALLACYAEGAVIESPIFHTVKGRPHIEKSFHDVSAASATGP